MAASLGGVRAPASWIRRSETAGALIQRRRPLSLSWGGGGPAPAGVRPLMARQSGHRVGAAGSGGDEAVESEAEGWRREVARTLLVDNYDSYTHNIYQELCVVNGVPPVVVRNDEWTWEYIRYCLYEEKAFDNIVISPGPGSPTCEKDIGICLQILLECEDIPILGVCLGHQALGFVHGARIIHAPEPVHGRLSEIEHAGCDLFCDIPSGRNSGFTVVRYHSLVIDADSLPKELIPTAWTMSMRTLSFLESQEADKILVASENGTCQLQSVGYFSDSSTDSTLLRPAHPSNSEIIRVIMGVMHTTRPHYGVQFHPESVATSDGRKIFENFKQITLAHGLRSSKPRKIKVLHASVPPKEYAKNDLLMSRSGPVPNLNIGVDPLSGLKARNDKHIRLRWKKIGGILRQIGGSERIFSELFGENSAKDTFWLDSSSTDQGRARFSFMGGKGGSLWKQMTFQLSDQSMTMAKCGGYLSIRDGHGAVKKQYLEDGLFDYLDKELRSFHYDKEDWAGLPFDFCGGFVGFIGYGLKVECGASSNCHKSTTPDACFFFADNLVVIDHSNDDVYILSSHDVHDTDFHFGVGQRSKAKSWLAEAEKKILMLKSMITNAFPQKVQEGSPLRRDESFIIDKPRHQYVKDVEKCLQFIKDGESYELCLTTQMRKMVNSVDALRLYLSLRNRNPAPYAAWLNFSGEDLCICCSSPERFLRLDQNNILEAKPIKGTISRGQTPEEDEQLRLQLQHSEKDQAENLMIVDLLRNDLGQVCEPGSVTVPRLMELESYATVHTLVSTIQGKKEPNTSPVHCVRAAFPGGSMTGAPKLRSMELLDSLESCSRGIYSGSIGFFSYNQTFDLNIVIRTVVIHKGEASVGAGGAIVALSNPEEEYAEMLLKAKAPTAVVQECTRELFPANSDKLQCRNQIKIDVNVKRTQECQLKSSEEK